MSPYDYAGLLYPFVLLGALLLLITGLAMRRWDARGTLLSGTQRVIAGLAVAAAIIPGIWLLATGALRSSGSLSVTIDLLIPVALTVPSTIPSLRARTSFTAACALALGVFCFLGGFSIGPLYLPAAALLVVLGVIGLASPRSVAQAKIQ